MVANKAAAPHPYAALAPFAVKFGSLNREGRKGIREGRKGKLL
jgi:hypothetical protein